MPGWNATHGEAVRSYALASWVFLRLLGVIYFAAFVSLVPQICGLAGNDGLLPASELLARRDHWGAARYWRWPTLCWVDSSDRALLALTGTGAVAALLLVMGVAPLPLLLLLWVLYLSLFTVGRMFLSYQWDVLLLEAGFLALLLATPELMPHFPPRRAPPVGAIWLGWWLLFRLMFWSGAVKLRSGDSAWRSLTALQHHYQTQPLPTPLAWYAHQLPAAFHKGCAILVFLIELGAPFLVLGPAPAKFVGAGLILGLMVAIQLTGNYAFFNLLAMSLCVLVFDDRAFNRVWHWVPAAPLEPAGRVAGAMAWLVALLVLFFSVDSLAALLRKEVRWPAPLARLREMLEPFHLVNSYGLFAVMTTWRAEIILEGSQDGHTWRPYQFRWKPGDVRRAPRFIAPHQPRLDWQMWFLALGARVSSSWFDRLRERLIEGSPAVLRLFQNDPFPEGPPRFVRVVYYDYRFTNREERRATGAWWVREQRGIVEG